VYNVSLTGAHGAVSTQQATFTLTGTNVAPVLQAGVPDLTVATNLSAGAAAGATVVAIFAPGSTANLLAGLPTLTTSTNYALGGSGVGYNYMGGHGWFLANGIQTASLVGDTVVFANGLAGKITAASNGHGTTESAYLYYRAYTPGQANLT
ncbi:hypothetical protein, partial [Pseudomonas sp. EA_65y_Pfl1_P113]|uniref:hypothetical protein n=1 Tax=Pseudomonas sp. EA_65y_Pfl1_P113 TaxID=3088692 RepID=UPI0030D72D44